MFCDCGSFRIFLTVFTQNIGTHLLTILVLKVEKSLVTCNSVLQRLIWVCTVCSSLSVPIFRVITVTIMQGPVVQSVVSLTSSLRVISLTVLADSIYNILIFFAEKM